MNMEKHLGYKAFKKDRTNLYGTKFEEKNIYSINNNMPISCHKYSIFNQSNGFHMSVDFANIFRYVEDDDVQVALVLGFGECQYFEDNYYGYHNMYACQNLYVIRFLSREEIIELILKQNDFELSKILYTFKFKYDEKIKLLKKHIGNDLIVKSILYSQFNFHTIYKDKQDVKRLIKKEFVDKKLI